AAERSAGVTSGARTDRPRLCAARRRRRRLGRRHVLRLHGLASSHRPARAAGASGALEAGFRPLLSLGLAIDRASAAHRLLDHLRRARRLRECRASYSHHARSRHRHDAAVLPPLVRALPAPRQGTRGQRHRYGSATDQPDPPARRHQPDARHHRGGGRRIGPLLDVTRTEARSDPEQPVEERPAAVENVVPERREPEEDAEQPLDQSIDDHVGYVGDRRIGDIASIDGRREQNEAEENPESEIETYQAENEPQHATPLPSAKPRSYGSLDPRPGPARSLPAQEASPWTRMTSKSSTGKRLIRGSIASTATGCRIACTA